MFLLLLVTENSLLQDLKRWIFSVETFINFWLSENYFKISFLSFQMPLFSLRSIMITEKQDERRKVLIRGVKSKGTWSWMRSHPRETRDLRVQSLLLPSHPSPGCVKDWEKREQELLCLERRRTAGGAGAAQERGSCLSRELQSHLSGKFRMTGLEVFCKSPYCRATSVSSFLFITV